MSDEKLEFPPPDPDRWDANDARRQKDCFAPPAEPCECYCLHCQRTFSSDKIWLQRVINARDGFEGFWMCPTNNCDGAGFTFDIFPVDPQHPANAGWVYDDDDEEYSEDEDDDENDDASAAANDETDAPFAPPTDWESSDESLLDPATAEEDFIDEGDEWKLGVRPDEPPPPGIYGTSEMRKEQARYDAPDERPRIIDASEHPEMQTKFEDDIPY